MIKNVNHPKYGPIKACEFCEGEGVIYGTIHMGGMLPDLECPKCFGLKFDPQELRKKKNESIK